MKDRIFLVLAIISPSLIIKIKKAPNTSEGYKNVLISNHILVGRGKIEVDGGGS